MKRVAKLALLFSAPFLLAALGMDDQPSYKSYEAPVLAPPAGVVPISGREVVTPRDETVNPVPSDDSSVERGSSLFAINCSMCHGTAPGQPGPVGLRFTPPPPDLAPARIKILSDGDIFKIVTFGLGRMPPFQDKLSPQGRWDLVNFLRNRK